LEKLLPLDAERLDPNLRRILKAGIDVARLAPDDPKRGAAVTLLDDLAARAFQPNLTTYASGHAGTIESTAKLGRYLLRGIAHQRGQQERATWSGLLETFFATYQCLLKAEDAGNQTALRRDALEVAGQVRELRLRRHIMTAHPLWARSHVARDWSAVWFAGSGPLREACAAACDTLQLRLQPPASADFAQSCWDRIRECSVAVFDLSVKGKDLADACYQMGIAFALGRTVVVTVPGGVVTPFDVGVAPIILDKETTKAVELIAGALEAALFDVGLGSEENTSAETFQHAILESRSSFSSDHLKKFVERLRVAGSDAFDPFQVEQNLATLWTGLDSAPMFIYPAWPGRYAGETARCFHIMPFSEPWSDSVRDSTKEACRDAGVEYDRGDIGEGESRVRREIWQKIGKATHIIADMTGNNPNVAFELAMAHTLGARPVLILRQKGDKEPPPDSLRHLRYVEYERKTDADLNAAVARFLDVGE
jgi:hypothetical protein